MNNFWDEDQVSEYDMIADDLNEAEAYSKEIADSIVEDMDLQETEVVEASEEQIESIQEEAAYQLDNKETNVIYNARLRLEQAKLYEMLINHSLFASVDANPDAVKIVENELKHFIVKRLEILLGISKPKPKQEDSESSIELPFNSVEINFLKQLAYKGTHGQSSHDTPLVVKPKPVLNPLSGSTKQNTTMPVRTQSTRQTQPAPAPKKEEPKPAPSKPQQKAQSTPQKKKTTKKTVQKKEEPLTKEVSKKPTKNSESPRSKISSGGSLRERKLTQAEIMELAKRDIEDMKDRKPIDKLKGKDKMKAIREVNEKHRRKSPKGPGQFPDAKQLEMEYLTREANGRTPQDVFQGMVKNIMNTNKIKIGE